MDAQRLGRRLQDIFKIRAAVVIILVVENVDRLGRAKVVKA